jgi:hypothetical protein
VLVGVVTDGPYSNVCTDHVDLVEINHFYDTNGKLVFDQMIFYNWCPVDSRYQVVDWRLWRVPSQVPTINRQGRNFVVVWHDRKERRVLRIVRSRMFRESWTDYDVELEEREVLPDHRRQGLKSVRVVNAELVDQGGRDGLSEGATRQQFR